MSFVEFSQPNYVRDRTLIYHMACFEYHEKTQESKIQNTIPTFTNVSTNTLHISSMLFRTLVHLEIIQDSHAY